MNKVIKIILIISAIVFGIGFLLINSAQAGVIQFGNKNIFVDFDGLPFDLSNWAPGMSSSPKTITITNNEDFDINLYFKAKKTSGDDILADVLTITIDNKSNHLSDLFNNNIALNSVNSGKSQKYNIVISFDQEAGNECQGKTINFDFIITAEEIGKGGEEIPPVIIPGGGTTYIPPTPTTPITETGEVTATPGEGGITSLTNPDGSKIELTIPPGAVSENTNFSINLVDISSVSQPDPASGLFLIAGLVYEIKAERDGEFITTFDKPLTLTFTYTDEQIEGLDEDSLKIYWWNGEEWVALENSEVDVDNNTVTVSIDHFTLFALMGSKIGFVEEEIEKEEGEEEIPSEEVVLAPTGEEEIEKPPEEGMEGEEGIVEPEEAEKPILAEEKTLGEIFATEGLLAAIGAMPFNLKVILIIFGVIIIGLVILRLIRKRRLKKFKG